MHLIYSKSTDPVISRPYDPINGQIGLSKPLLILPSFFLSVLQIVLILIYTATLFFAVENFMFIYRFHVYYFEEYQIKWKYYFFINNCSNNIYLNSMNIHYLYKCNKGQMFDIYTDTLTVDRTITRWRLRNIRV